MPAEGCWEGAGEIRFMLASNVVMQVKVLTTDPPEETLGYARLRLGRVGEGEFDVDGEVSRIFPFRAQLRGRGRARQRLSRF